MLVSNPLKKFQKNACEKVISEMEFFTFFLLCAKICDLYLLLGELLCIFSTDSNSASNFAFYDTHIAFLPKTFFLAFISTFC
jgi:hypothetical protein